VHIYILGPKLLRCNFLETSQLSIRSGAHKLFRPFFGHFTIFDRNFAKIVAPSSDENENCVVHLKEQSLLKKTTENLDEMAYKRQRNACSNYAPVERTLLRTRSLTKKNTTFSHLQPARVV